MEGQPPLYDDVYGFVFQSICLKVSLWLCPTSQSAAQTALLVGEPLAKRQSFPDCQGLPY